MALRKVYETPVKRWADGHAAFHNAHFETNGAPWIAEDFMGRGDRAGRIQQAKKDKAETDMLNFNLARIEQSKGKQAKNIPFWARTDWDGLAPEGVKPYGG